MHVLFVCNEYFLVRCCLGNPTLVEIFGWDEVDPFYSFCSGLHNNLSRVCGLSMGCVGSHVIIPKAPLRCAVDRNSTSIALQTPNYSNCARKACRMCRTHHRIRAPMG